MDRGCVAVGHSGCDRCLAVAPRPASGHERRWSRSAGIPEPAAHQLAAHWPNDSICFAHLLDDQAELLAANRRDYRSIPLIGDIFPGPIWCRERLACTTGLLSFVATRGACSGLRI